MPEEIDITKIKHVPIAMFNGIQDTTVPIENTRWANKNLNTTILY